MAGINVSQDEISRWEEIPLHIRHVLPIICDQFSVLLSSALPGSQEPNGFILKTPTAEN